MKNTVKHPIVSVIMNCFNGEKYLREAIESVYIQIYTNWEIIFWDNASTDQSAEIAKNYDDRLRYFKGEKTVTLGCARNLAIEQAKGEYIAFLDCDDIWLPEKLERQIPLFKNSQVGLVYCDVIQFNHRGYAKPKYGKYSPPQGEVFEAILMNNFLCMSTVVLRSEVMKKYQEWFDPLFTVIEDTDLFVRVSRNWEVAYVPFLGCKYRMHENSESFSSPMLFRQEEEMMVGKFSKIFPEFKNLYESRWKQQIERDRAIVEWQHGNGSMARKRVSRFIFRKFKYFMTYLAMFFPYKMAHRIKLFFSSRAVSNYCL